MPNASVKKSVKTQLALIEIAFHFINTRNKGGISARTPYHLQANHLHATATLKSHRHRIKKKSLFAKFDHNERHATPRRTVHHAPTERPTLYKSTKPTKVIRQHTHTHKHTQRLFIETLCAVSYLFATPPKRLFLCQLCSYCFHLHFHVN